MDFMDEGIAMLREGFGRPVLGMGKEEVAGPSLPEADVDAVISMDKSGKVSLNHVGMAEYLRDTGFRYVDGRMFRFDGRFLVPVSKQDMMDALVSATREAGHALFVTASTRDNVIAYWMSIANPARMRGDGCGDIYDGWLIPFENGLYSVGRAELLPFTPDVLFEGCVHTAYSPERAEAADERMRAVYKGIFGSDAALDFFLLAAGYTLYSESLSPPAIFVLIGRGGTGKSAVLNAMEALLGSDRVSNLSPAKLSTQFGLSRLKGMAANLCDEAGARARTATVDGDLMKAISAGRPWDSEAKFKDIEKFVNKAKLWFAANSMPDFGDTSSGMMRRVFIFPCDILQDPSSRIYDAMTSEDGRAWLAINALKAFIAFKWEGREEFDPPEEMEARKMEFCVQDTVLSWMSETFGGIGRDTGRRNLDGMGTGVAYNDYKIMTLDGGRTPVTRATFVSRLCTEYSLRATKKNIRTDLGYTSRSVFSAVPDKPYDKAIDPPRRMEAVMVETVDAEAERRSAE